MEFKDYYEILGVSKAATQKEIQKTYRRLAREFHPDVNAGSNAETRFKEIGEAYGVLSDPEKRAKYDRYGQAWEAVQNGQASSGFGGFGFQGSPGSAGFPSEEGDFETFFDVLEHLFGSGHWAEENGTSFRWSSGGGLETRGRNVEASLEITLEEAAAGGTRGVTVMGQESGKRMLNLEIPTGILPGEKLRLTGQGEPGIGGGRAGDLLLEVRVAKHPRFRLDGLDLHAFLPVTPSQAALGDKVKFRTLDETVSIRVPPGASSGQRIRLKGKGFPSRSGTGDLYMETQIRVPERLTAKERELYEKLAEITPQEDQL